MIRISYIFFIYLIIYQCDTALSSTEFSKDFAEQAKSFSYIVGWGKRAKVKFSCTRSVKGCETHHSFETCRYQFFRGRILVHNISRRSKRPLGSTASGRDRGHRGAGLSTGSRVARAGVVVETGLGTSTACRARRGGPRAR